MFMRRLSFAGSLVALLCALSACNQSDPKPAPPAATPPLSSVARLHWLGRKQLDADTNAAHLTALWNLPESARLAAQVLEKLSAAPWGLQRGSATPTNPPFAQFRVLLDDVLAAESFLEIRGATNQPGELAFAIHLDAGRAALWQTNLAAVFESLTGQRTAPTADGWTLTQARWPKRIELSRAGEWTLFGLAAETNSSLGALALQLQSFVPTPAGTPAPEFLAADFDAPGVSRALGLGWHLPAAWPRIALNLTCGGGAVRTRAGLAFAQPLQLELADWNFPTNLIHDPLVSFTAVRGLTKWLDSMAVWQDLPLGPAPSQLFTWAANGIPLQTYLAIPAANASNQVEKLSASLLDRSRQYLLTNSFGHLERATNGALNWVDFPFLPPSVAAMSLPAGDFIVAGWSPVARTNARIPIELISQFLPRTNLVYYDWELTESRVEAWIYLGQSLRLVSHHAQLPPKGVAQNWLNALAPKLGNCVTAAALTGPNQLGVTRTSSCGFTALELQLLADWLEAPDFPSGLHTLNAEPDPRLYKRPGSPTRPPGPAAPPAPPPH